MSYDPLSTGPSGYSGAPGPIGESGYSGSIGGYGESGYSGYSGAAGGSTLDHNLLNNLSYATANHTGFQSGIDWDYDYETYLIYH